MIIFLFCVNCNYSNDPKYFKRLIILQCSIYFVFNGNCCASLLLMGEYTKWFSCWVENHVKTFITTLEEFFKNEIFSSSTQVGLVINVSKYFCMWMVEKQSLETKRKNDLLKDEFILYELLKTHEESYYGTITLNKLEKRRYSIYFLDIVFVWKLLPWWKSFEKFLWFLTLKRHAT